MHFSSIFFFVKTNRINLFLFSKKKAYFTGLAFASPSIGRVIGLS
jgi:hypothetical protein